MTKIEWLARPGAKPEAWNPVTGCTKVSEGCRNCYAETMSRRFWAARGRDFNEVLCHENRLENPLHWRSARTCFVNSMSDLFHEDVPNEFIAEVFGLMAVAGARDPDGGPESGRFGGRYDQRRGWVDRSGPHTFIVLTKRAARMRTLLASLKFRESVAKAAFRWAHNRRDAGYLAHQIGMRQEYARCYEPGRMWPLSNVWLGVSVEDQRTADERIPLLLQTPAAVRFVSAEPLIGEINLSWYTAGYEGRPDWVIVGGESGPKARPCDVAWVRRIVGQCQSANVPCFVKQVGSRPYSSADRITHRDNPISVGEGFARYLNNRKGADPSEWPADLRVREWPEVQR